VRSFSWRNFRRLQDENIISRYVALLNPSKVGIDVVAFVSITVGREQYRHLREFEKVIIEFPEVLECYKVTGDYDYMLKVVAPDLQTFSLFMTKRLMQAPGIIRVKSAVTLGEVKYTTALPIESMR
jgi:Lrp/AsnC family leucine-responsive transcriptional regulator